MGISVTRQDDRFWVIGLGERFDFGSVEEFRRAYESVDTSNKITVKIDFRGTRYMDSSALGMLINAKSRLKGNGENRVVLCNCNEQIKKIFSISKFEKKFDIE